MSHRVPCETGSAGSLVQSRQLSDSPALFIAEQVIVVVRGHLDRGMPHQIAHRRQIAAFPQEGRREQVPDIVQDHGVGDPGTPARRPHGPADLFDLPAVVFDDKGRLGGLLHFPKPRKELVRDGYDPAGLGLGSIDGDRLVFPVHIAPL